MRLRNAHIPNKKTYQWIKVKLLDRYNRMMTNVRIIVVFVISIAAIIFLNVFGTTIFGINNVHDCRKGYRENQLHIVKLQFFFLPFSVLTYFRLVEFAELTLAKHLRIVTACTILWLFLAHSAYLLFLVPDQTPRFFATLSFLSLGLWYHVAILLSGFGILRTVMLELNVNASCRWPIRKCFFKFSILRSFCLNKNKQVAFTLAISVISCFISYLFCDRIVIKHLSVEVKDLPSSANGIRFALISDIHAGLTISEKQIERIVHQVNGQAIDAVFLVGDAVDGTKDSVEDLVKPLQFLIPKTFYVSGNHEYYYCNASEWFDLFQRYGFEVLNNRHVIFRGICIAGVNDYSSGKSGLPNHAFKPVEALKGCPQNSTVLILSHNPAPAKDIAFNDAHLRVDLILSGHTHAGQLYVVAPIAYLMMNYFYGLYQIAPETRLFVTAGTLYSALPMKMEIKWRREGIHLP